MIELNIKELDGVSYAFVQLFLPGYCVRFVYGTKGVLTNLPLTKEIGQTALFSVDAISFEEMLEAPIVYGTQLARSAGIYIGMTGRKALGILHEKNKTYL